MARRFYKVFHTGEAILDTVVLKDAYGNRTEMLRVKVAKGVPPTWDSVAWEVMPVSVYKERLRPDFVKLVHMEEAHAEGNLRRSIEPGS